MTNKIEVTTKSEIFDMEHAICQTFNASKVAKDFIDSKIGFYVSAGIPVSHEDFNAISYCLWETVYKASDLHEEMVGFRSVSETNAEAPVPSAAPAPSVLIKDIFYELDDAVGQLSSAAEILEILTEDHISNKATSPLHDQIERIRQLVEKGWPTAVGRPTVSETPKLQVVA